MSGHLEAKSPIEGTEFRLAPTKAAVNDSSNLEKNVPRCIRRMYSMSRRSRRLHLFFQCPFARKIWTAQRIVLVEAIYEMSFWASL